MNDVTQILQSMARGDSLAEELMPLVYEDLRRLATAKLAREKPGQTLQATALVHEAWLRVSEGREQWDGRGHFFAAAAEAMRRILVDNARRKMALKRGGVQEKIELNEFHIVTESEDDELARQEPRGWWVNGVFINQGKVEVELAGKPRREGSRGRSHPFIPPADWQVRDVGHAGINHRASIFPPGSPPPAAGWPCPG